MNQILSIAKLEIHDGKLEEFKDVARTCIQLVKEKDTRTIRYEWFLNEDDMECVVEERYEDSSALLEHVGNMGDILGRLFAVSTFSAKICGSPSEELVNALQGFDITYYNYAGGLN